MKRLLFFLSFVICSLTYAQNFPFELKIDSISIPELGGLQSYAVGQANGKWLIIGGRLDGLHRRQPWATFDSIGHNTQLIVIDPIEKKRWTAPLTSLSETLQDQLSATNMEFNQKGDYLYLVGGYGLSNRVKVHITYPNLAAIHVPTVIDAIINQKDFSSAIYQIQDEQFAITGGKMFQVNDVFFITGGQRFDGAYNPMNNPTFTQKYTSAIKSYTFDVSNNQLTFNHLKDIVDEEYLHRRDYNVLPQILPDGRDGLISFSGVFQKELNLPYLYAVAIDHNSFKVVPDFAQYYNHYHCAAISLFDEQNKQMNNLFFGGIAQYFDSLGVLTQDNDVPFVRTVSLVTVAENGQMAEYKLPIEMPDYLGSASEFIVNPELKVYPNGVISQDGFSSDKILLGYIYGGIKSSAANVFWINTGVESSASEMIYPVYIINTNSNNTLLNTQSINGLQLQIYPDPIEDELYLFFTLKKESSVLIEVVNEKGKVRLSKNIKNSTVGKQSLTLRLRKLKRGEVYLVHLTVNGEKTTQRMIVN